MVDGDSKCCWPDGQLEQLEWKGQTAVRQGRRWLAGLGLQRCHTEEGEGRAWAETDGVQRIDKDLLRSVFESRPFRSA